MLLNSCKIPRVEILQTMMVVTTAVRLPFRSNDVYEVMTLMLRYVPQPLLHCQRGKNSSKSLSMTTAYQRLPERVADTGGMYV